MSDNDVIRIEVNEDEQVGGMYARAYMRNGEHRDVPLVVPLDDDASDDDVRAEVAADAITGDVPDDCPVERE